MSLANVLASVVSLQNPTGAVNQNSAYEKLNWNEKVAEAYSQWDAYAEELAATLRENVASVRNELRRFTEARKMSPVNHAVRCFIFSLLSPQTNFEENVVAAQQIMSIYETISSVDDILPALYVPFHGTGNTRLLNLGLSKAKYLYEALPWLRSLTNENIETEFTYENVIKQKGIGEKTASFALALYNEHSEVFTLDTWILRMTIALAGGNPRVIVSPTKKGYEITKSKWITFVKNNLPDLSIFEAQWTAWNLAFGQHKSHLGILAA